jgi:hypothetical protein
MNNENLKDKQLILIPKINDYVEYMTNFLIKLPRTEKFSIGNEYKNSMYHMITYVLYVNKINRKENNLQAFELLNKVDVELNCQRIYLRIMNKQKWIDNKKFEVSMSKIYEIGNIIGGLVKYYAKNNKK